ncbi:hypothetical protein KUV89_03610 [Marinobacter hydrocarbonoclasticus]|nr:hypothetical protein [Marinobacter nauticus]
MSQLLDAYKGEIYGIAFFQQMLNHRPQETALWQRMLDLESRTAALLAPAMASQVPALERAELWKKGVAEAKRWQHLPPAELFTTLVDWVEPYEIRYRRWAEAEADAALTMVADHETALYRSLVAARDDKDALRPLNDFLNRYSR